MSTIKQITVFGGSGFIGRHLIRRLARTGAIIRVPTREPEKALLLRPMGDVGQIVPFACSTRHDVAVTEAIGNSDAVINLIGILYKKGRDTFQAVHVETAARIARIARQNGATRFVQISALGADTESASSYARSKATGEKAVRTFFPDAVVIRPGVIFGPEDNFFNLFATVARYSPFLPLIGGGATRLQPVYVGDVAEAIDRALTQKNTDGATFELGGPKAYSFRELMELMLSVTGQRRCLVDIPWGLAKLQAAFLEQLPRPLLTRDQVELLKADNILRGRQAKTFRDLGITPTAIEVILPSYLARFRKG